MELSAGEYRLPFFVPGRCTGSPGAIEGGERHEKSCWVGSDAKTAPVYKLPRSLHIVNRVALSGKEIRVAGACMGVRSVFLPGKRRKGAE